MDRKIKIIIVEDDVETRKSLLNFLSHDSKINISSFFTSGVDIISEIKIQKPDIVITDFFAVDINNFKILEVINLRLKENGPKIIVTSDSNSVSILEKSFKFGSDYYIKKPVILSHLKDAIFHVLKKDGTFQNDGIYLKIKIKNMIKSVGVPTNVLGYTYIEDALNYMINSNKVLFLSEIYREISVLHNTNLNCVEIAIRNAIKKAAKISNNEFKNIFDFCKSRPSNSVFLSTLREKILIETLNI